MVSNDRKNSEMLPPGPLAVFQPPASPVDARQPAPGGGYLWNQDATNGIPAD